MSFNDGQVLYSRYAMGSTAVRFTGVTKTYHLYPNERARLLHVFSSRVAVKDVDANRELSFTINRGESVAFLGNNGAGKTTLLKMIAGVSYPTHGTVEVNGRVSAMLNLTAGFDPQLTGEENLRQRGHIWGLGNKEIDALLPGIIDFTELGEFIRQPLRTYSSGMRARLGFAFVSSLKPDILILDEVLAVGDRQFAQKSLAQMKEIMSRDEVTMLFVTHNSASAQQFCQRGIVLDQGRLVFDGPIQDAVRLHEGRSATA